MYLYLYLFVSRYLLLLPPIDAPRAENLNAPTGPANDPIAPPTTEPTLEPMLLLSDDVPLSPVVMSVNTHEQSYVRCMVLVLIIIKL